MMAESQTTTAASTSTPSNTTPLTLTIPSNSTTLTSTTPSNTTPTTSTTPSNTTPTTSTTPSNTTPTTSTPSSSAVSVFTRRPSLFKGKKRKQSLVIALSPPISEEPSPLDDQDCHSPNTLLLAESTSSINTKRASSISSLSALIGDGSLRRSASRASRDSRTSPNASQSPSVATSTPTSPRPHLTSRSVSSNATSSFPFRFGTYPSTVTSPTNTHGKSIPIQIPNLADFDLPPPRTPLSMLATPFGHAVKRQETGTSKQSVSAEGVSNYAGLASANPNAIYNNIHDVSKKRMATLDYLRKVHEGQTYYFNTLQYSPANLSHMPSLLPSKLGRRATNYLLLGTSIPPLLDCNTGSPLEYLSALQSLLVEFETFQNSEGGLTGARGRMGQMFKSSMRMRTGRRASAANFDNMYDGEHGGSTPALDAMPLPPVASYNHQQEFAYLQTPSLPFEPDFATAFATLTEVLMGTYDNLTKLVPGPEVCSSNLNEAFIKADKMIRKLLVQNVVQEFGDTTRKEVKSEVAGLGKVVLSGLM